MTRLTEVLVSEALKPSFARDEIARRVGAAISDGRLPVGTPIRQQCLADLYSVSRMPVREALRQLEAQGMLVCDEHKGMKVAAKRPEQPRSPDDEAEIYRLHSEFIAVDEPNNEQVMAFQDASYALGLKRGQAHEAALQQLLNTADQRADDLAALLFQALPFLTDTPDLVQHGAEELAAKIEAAIKGNTLPPGFASPDFVEASTHGRLNGLAP